MNHQLISEIVQRSGAYKHLGIDAIYRRAEKLAAEQEAALSEYKKHVAPKRKLKIGDLAFKGGGSDLKIIKIDNLSHQFVWTRHSEIPYIIG